MKIPYPQAGATGARELSLDILSKIALSYHCSIHQAKRAKY